MSISITINVETAEEARRHLAELLGDHGAVTVTGTPALELPAPGEAPVTGSATESMLQSVAGRPVAEVLQPAAQPAKRKPGRPRTSDDPKPETSVSSPAGQTDSSPTGEATQPAETPNAAAQADTGVSAGTSSEAEPALKIEDVKDLLQKVAAKTPGNGGLEAVSAILAEHGYQKVKEIQPEHFAAIALKCRAKLAA